MLVSDVMVDKVGYIEKEATVVEASEMMRAQQIGSVIVVEREGRNLIPVGVVTDRDIVVEVVADHVETGNLTVEDIMSQDLTSILSTASIFTAIRSMESDGIRRLPVVDEKGYLCGIVSADDIASHLAVAMHSLSKIPRIQMNYEEHKRVSHVK